MEKREKSAENRQSDVSGNFALCHEVAQKKGMIRQGPREQCVEKFRPVPRGGVKGKREKNKDSVGDRLCNKFGILFFSLCPLRWRKNEETHT